MLLIIIQKHYLFKLFQRIYSILTKEYTSLEIPRLTNYLIFIENNINDIRTNGGGKKAGNRKIFKYHRRERSKIVPQIQKKKTNNRSIRITSARISSNSVHTFAIGLESQRRVLGGFCPGLTTPLFTSGLRANPRTCGMRLAILRGDASRPRGR